VISDRARPLGRRARSGLGLGLRENCRLKYRGSVGALRGHTKDLRVRA
jgi:hypothetical protein